MSTANLLGEQGVEIDTLITFDPHQMTGDLSLTGDNVGSAVNFYQRNASTGPLGLPLPRGDNPYRGRAVNGASNHDLTGVATGDRFGRFVHNDFINQVNNDFNLRTILERELP